ncbi:MAG TPA: ribosome small subunit-dependent GTPase A [Caulobacteraceae bacterium]|nr:ribosome small subunit-dependent GTPase A [Caulobacteraceae bacterium]
MIEQYGWSDRLRQDFAPFAARDLTPGRVVVQQRGLYGLVTELGELSAEISGRLAHEAGEGGYPAVGDWVAAAARPAEGAATIHHVLPRATSFVRRAAGPKLAEQVVAANVDVAFLVASLNADLNARRLERYLSTAWQSGAKPVIVLIKADLCDDVGEALEEIEAVAFGTPVLAVSAITGEGLEAVRAHLGPGLTAVLVGSSGVGKSTLLNALAGEEMMAVGAISGDALHGRHTTTHRELVLLPGGGLMLDTPGMRELGLWDSDDGLSVTFEDIEQLAERCHFRDCAHGSEPGCAVREALHDGALDHGRWKSYQKLQRELAHLERKEDRAAHEAERRRWIAISKAQRAGKKARGKAW